MSADAQEATALRLVLRRLQWDERGHCRGGCYGSKLTGHNDRCWLGELVTGTPGPAYDAAIQAVLTEKA